MRLPIQKTPATKYQFCQTQGLQQQVCQALSVVEPYVDNSISGSTDSRPALDRMMADAHAGRLDVVACWRLDRIGRSLAQLVRVLDELGMGGSKGHEQEARTVAQWMGKPKSKSQLSPTR